MLADFFTKPLQGILFRRFRDVLLGYKHVNTLTTKTVLPSPVPVEDVVNVPTPSPVKERVGINRSDDGNVNEKYKEEIDDDGFTTTRTKKTKREMMKRSKTVTWKDIEKKKCKSVPRAILLKQSS
jgi:hypothetical protein